MIRPHILAGVLSGMESSSQTPAFLSGLLAYWDFSESAAPFVSKMGLAGPVALNQGPGSAVSKVNDGPTGNAINLNGTTDYLICPAAETGLLNIGKNGGDKATVLAFYKASASGATNDFIAGIWQEDTADPKRQYGLFYSLPMYGGAYKACMHVSKTGGPSPGIEYSRDYSANGYTESGDRLWTCLAGTYDAVFARSYIEGRFEPYADFGGLPKNPYSYNLGLNAADGDFTVGAVKLTGGMGNFTSGRIAAVMVFNRALSASEIAMCQRWIDTGNAFGYRHSFYRSNTTTNQPVSFFGCQAYIAPNCIDRSNDVASNAWKSVYSAGVAAINTGSTNPTGIRAFVNPVVPEGITTENLQSISLEMANTWLAPKWRILIKIGNMFYASNDEFGVDVAATSTSDWTNSKIANLVFNRLASNWKDVVIDPGVALTLSATVRTENLPAGVITAFGVIKDGSTPGDMQFRNLTLKVNETFAG